MPELDLKFVDEAVARIGRGGENVIAVLQAIQEHYRYLPEPALRRVCEVSDITPAAIAGVSTFYTQFRHQPVGKHVIRVCHGTACHIKGAQAVSDAIRTTLGMAPGLDSDGEGLFTLEKIACLGCCTLAPVVQIDEVIYGHLTSQTVPRMIRDFLQSRQGGARRRPKAVSMEHGEMGEIRVGLGSCCQARGSARVFEAVENVLSANGLSATVKRVGCVGMCHQTPLVEVVVPGRENVLYAQVRPEDTQAIILRHFRPRGAGRRLAAAAGRMLDSLLTDEAWTPPSRYSLDVRDDVVTDFLGRQQHLATEHCGVLDPLDLDEYERRDGFVALRKALGEMKPTDIVHQIEASGLRGRGGAGFPTGKKWATVASSGGWEKYIICNCDEGDPGAFMDRMLLESYPYRVIEGMIIAARAVGATQGYLYIRAEYPLAVKRVGAALEALRDRGLIGPDILGSGVGLELRIMEGAGAFVCGEETALIASIEGRRGMPRFRPPFPAQSGLWGKPTLVNNVETYALVPWIVRNGAAAFAGRGTDKSKGTKVFALAGKVVRGGLIEVPMGVTLHQIVQEIGGGIAGGKMFKAVQIGGPSGGCVPAELANIAVDYDALTSVGAIMGSGGLVVLDENDCMVDIARYFLSFTQDQSCGKCTFCRVGTRVMLDILERLCGGQGRKDDLQQLEDLAHKVKKGSLCGLGGTAPNPVLSTLRYFRHEYEAHLAGRCPAHSCKALIHYRITDDCIGCTKCSQQCPADAIVMKPYEKHEIDQAKCVKCGGCKAVCPVQAVNVE